MKRKRRKEKVTALTKVVLLKVEQEQITLVHKAKSEEETGREGDKIEQMHRLGFFFCCNDLVINID